MDCSLVLSKDATPPNFINSNKISKFTQVFSLKSFLLESLHVLSETVESGSLAVKDPSYSCLLIAHFPSRTGYLIGNCSLSLNLHYTCRICTSITRAGDYQWLQSLCWLPPFLPLFPIPVPQSCTPSLSRLLSHSLTLSLPHSFPFFSYLSSPLYRFLLPFSLLPRFSSVTPYLPSLPPLFLSRSFPLLLSLSSSPSPLLPLLLFL